jgi:hypothetical protein
MLNSTWLRVSSAAEMVAQACLGSWKRMLGSLILSGRSLKERAMGL